MKQAVSAIYITSGTLLVALTYFNSFGGPRFFENIGLFFILIGVIIQIRCFFQVQDK